MAPEQLSRTLPLAPLRPAAATVTQPLQLPATPSAPTPSSDQRSRSLFRERALLAHSSGECAAEPLQIAPMWTRWTVLVGALLTLGAVVSAFFVRIELISTGRGMLQASGPPRVLTAQVEGRVVAVAVGPGDQVTQDQELLRIESVTTEANLVEANRAAALAEAALADFTARKKPLYERRNQQLIAQANALARRTNSGRATVARMARRAADFEQLGQHGLTSALDVDGAKEAISVATREALRSEEEGARILDQLAALELERLNEETRLKEELGRATARREALQLSLQACVVRSPTDGVMGALPLRVGDALASGALIGRVVPLGTPRTVVAYVPERDRAFLRNGGRVRVEVDQLPLWEFGALQGRIVNIGTELATSADLRATFGEGPPPSEPLYRVDVALDADTDSFRKLASKLRPESLTSVRFNLRERRLITVLIEPLRRWLD